MQICLLDIQNIFFTSIKSSVSLSNTFVSVYESSRNETEGHQIKIRNRFWAYTWKSFVSPHDLFDVVSIKFSHSFHDINKSTNIFLFLNTLFTERIIMNRKSLDCHVRRYVSDVWLDDLVRAALILVRATLIIVVIMLFTTQVDVVQILFNKRLADNSSLRSKEKDTDLILKKITNVRTCIRCQSLVSLWDHWKIYTWSWVYAIRHCVYLSYAVVSEAMIKLKVLTFTILRRDFFFKLKFKDIADPIRSNEYRNLSFLSMSPHDDASRKSHRPEESRAHVDTVRSKRYVQRRQRSEWALILVDKARLKYIFVLIFWHEEDFRLVNSQRGHHFVSTVGMTTDSTKLLKRWAILLIIDVTSWSHPSLHIQEIRS